MITRQTLSDPQDVAEALANRVAKHLFDRITRDGAASLAVSGGRTPMRFFEALSRMEIDWACVSITLVDERWVDESSPRSNAALVRAGLLQNKAKAAHFVPLYRAGPAPENAVAAVEADLVAMPQPFAAVVLGMGDDGHTASFFPRGDTLADAIDPDYRGRVITLRADAACEPRITLTLAALLEADMIALHIEGAGKQAVLEEAMKPGDIADMPIRAILRQNQVPVSVVWCP